MFRETEWDAQELTFRGKICWFDDYQTTWQGCRRWDYEMTFDSQFTFIIAGTVRAHYVHEEELNDMSTFGLDLIYINAAFPSKLKDLFGEEVNATMRRRMVEQDVLQRARTEGATVRTIAMIRHVCTRAALMSVETEDQSIDGIIDHNLE